MARFLVLNFEDFGLNQDITKSIQSQTLFCICCLDKNVPLIDLSKCPHSTYLDTFEKPRELKLYKYVICHCCHKMLRKIYSFKQLVEQSFKLLASKTFTPSKAECIRIPTLETIKMTNMSLDTSQNIETKQKTTSNLNNLSTDTANVSVNPNNTTFDIEPISKEKKKPTPRMKKERAKSKKETENSSTIVKQGRNSLAEVKIEFEPNAGELVISAPPPQEPMDIISTPDLPIPEPETEITDQSKLQAITTVTLNKDELMRERVHSAQSKQYLKCPYRCENCIIGFHYEENVIDHMIRRHGPKVGSLTCEICLQVLYPPGSLNAHNFRHYTRYDCTRCGQRYATFDDAMAHYRKTHRNKDTAFKCRFCRFTTSNYNNLKVHKILQHHRYSCKYCGVMMSSATNLTKHLGTVHKKLTLRPEPEPAWCSACDLTFKTKHALELHTTKSLVHIQRDDKYTCGECGMKFAGVTHLRMHVESHGNVTTHRCHHCPMEFTLELEMLEHIEAKHVERSQIMICDLCGRAYKNRHFFIRHMSMHNVLKRKVKGEKVVRRKKTDLKSD